MPFNRDVAGEVFCGSGSIAVARSSGNEDGSDGDGDVLKLSMDRLGTAYCYMLPCSLSLGAFQGRC